MKTILVTGANGFLASYIYRENKDKFNWIRIVREDCDFADPQNVREFIEKQDFDICFHSAANATTAVCEEQPELAHKINVESTKEIVDICKKKKCTFNFLFN